MSLGFSGMSAISKLKTWEQFISFLEGISQEFLSILEFLGRIISFILIPYRFIAEKLTQLLPFNIPPEYSDFVIIGFIVVLVPYIELGTLSSYGHPYLTILSIKRLKRFLTRKRKKINTISIKDLNRKVDSFKNNVLQDHSKELVLSIENQNPTKIKQELVSFHNFIDQYLMPVIPELNELLVDYKKIIWIRRRRFLVALLILILIVLDAFYLGEGIGSLFVLGKGLLTMMVFILSPLILLGLFALFGYLFKEFFNLLSDMNIIKDTSDDLIRTQRRDYPLMVAFILFALPVMIFGNQRVISEKESEEQKIIDKRLRTAPQCEPKS